jgi:hypothetical protein
MNNAFAVIECDEGTYCQNSITSKGEAGAKCVLCRLAPGNENLTAHFWKPFRKPADFITWKTEHPALQKEKREKSFLKRSADRAARFLKDRAKQKLAKKAEQAERETEANIIKSSVNSGRKNRDGDHLVAGSICMDTKLQSTRTNPVVSMLELDKVNRDAKGGIGCLCLRNKFNRGVVVLTEESFSRLTKEL